MRQDSERVTQNGHCLQNRSTQEALVLEVGTRIEADINYFSDIDLVAPARGKPEIQQLQGKKRAGFQTYSESDRRSARATGMSRPEVP